MKRFSLLFALILVGICSNAQLIINELSQGPTGNREYVELLVTGTPACGSSNTVDLRGWIIDDNNSWHASGSGTGIAGGHVRFDSIPQWANIKIGTLILIYNDADTSGAVHALTVDTNDANGDCTYVIPVSSSVLQKNTTLPASNGSMTTYGTAGTPYSIAGTWTVLGMANGGDAFHTVSPDNYGVPYHAIGWGNNNALTNVYYSGSQSGMVIYMTNAVSNDPFNSANYIDTTASNSETPGAPNNAANAAWINQLKNNCQPFTPPVVSFNNPGSITCSISSVTIVASSSVNGSTFSWSNSTTGANNTVSAGGTYYVTVNDAANVCTTVDSVTISGSSNLSITATANNTTCGSSNGTANVGILLGIVISYNWSNGGTTATISNLAAGTYSVTVTGTGSCTATASVTVSSSSGTSVTITSDKNIFCTLDSAHVCAPSGYQSYLWNTGAITSCVYVKAGGNYYVTVTDNSNCTAESNHLAIAVYPQPPVSISVNGDTLNAYNAVSYQWFLNNNPIPGANDSAYIAPQSGSYIVQITDSNGCSASSNAVVVNVTGVKNISANTEFSIYPNPRSKNSWSLEVGVDLLGTEVEIFDNNGGLVYQSKIQNVKTTIDTDLAKGIYLLKVNNGQNTVTKKLTQL